MSDYTSIATQRKTSFPTAPHEAARRYLERGLAVCPIKPGEKRPGYRGWTTGSLRPEAFQPEDNVGVVCGWHSDGGRPGHALVCVDLDDPEALLRADELLPETAMVEGRAGKPRSHRFYLIPTSTIPDWARSNADQAASAARESGNHPGPLVKHFKRPDGTATIDFLGTGGQVAVPPSRHHSGEVREWDVGLPGEPAVVSFDLLWNAVCRLARAAGSVVPSTGAPPDAVWFPRANGVSGGDVKSLGRSAIGGPGGDAGATPAESTNGSSGRGGIWTPSPTRTCPGPAAAGTTRCSATSAPAPTGS